jgi:hypothetical protein
VSYVDGQPSTYDNFQTFTFHILTLKYFETKTCHLMIAQPSTYLFFFKNANMSYDMFALIELYCRKVQSVMVVWSLLEVNEQLCALVRGWVTGTVRVLLLVSWWCTTRSLTLGNSTASNKGRTCDVGCVEMIRMAEIILSEPKLDVIHKNKHISEITFLSRSPIFI